MNRKPFFAAVILLALLALLLSASGAVAQAPALAGGTISYSGRLSDEAGRPVADGAYDFTFALYDAPEGGSLLWSETQTGVAVQGGAFTARLGSVTPLAKEARISKGWLAVSVRGPGETGFTALTPRQALSAAASLAPASPSAGPACAHDHFGESWRGSGRGLEVSSADDVAVAGLRPANSSAIGFVGVFGVSSSTPANVLISDRSGVGGYGDDVGVYGLSNTGIGVHGYALSGGTGVYGEGPVRGVYGSGGIGVAGVGATYGVSGTVTGASGAGVYGEGPNGVVGVSHSTGWAAVAGTSDATNGIGVWAASYSGNPIEAWSSSASNRRFYVSNAGNVYADGTYYGAGGVNTTCAPNCADYAETMDADETAPSYEPGDVLVVNQEGLISLSSTPYATNVVGVYSTRPAFLARAGDTANQVPVALVGVVPVKVSAENGPIHPGDLLVASSTPGHAMRAPANHAPGTVIGKALGSLKSGTGTIEMLVMLR